MATTIERLVEHLDREARGERKPLPTLAVEVEPSTGETCVVREGDGRFVAVMVPAEAGDREEAEELATLAAAMSLAPEMLAIIEDTAAFLDGLRPDSPALRAARLFDLRRLAARARRIKFRG